MYYIKKSEWDKIPNDYKGTSIFDKNIKTCLECFLVSGGAFSLCFEHEHFEIVKDN